MKTIIMQQQITTEDDYLFVMRWQEYAEYIAGSTNNFTKFGLRKLLLLANGY